MLIAGLYRLTPLIADNIAQKLPAFLRPAPDVQNRSERHDRRTTSSWAKTPSSELEHVRASLEKKAKLYEQLQRGKTAGLSEDRIRDSLIDWDRKEIDETKEELADSAHTDDEGEMTDYEDEFGRSRRVKRSEVPRYAIDAQRRKQEESHDDRCVLHVSEFRTIVLKASSLVVL